MAESEKWLAWQRDQVIVRLAIRLAIAWDAKLTIDQLKVSKCIPRATS
jgi:hypothetical protein